jgi:hypothetical protein
MTKLTQAQQLVLASACDHECGLAVRPDKLRGVQLAKMTTSLIDKGLAKEIKAKPGGPIWREDEQGRGFSLKILKAGRDVVSLSSANNVDTVVEGATPIAVHDVGMGQLVTGAIKVNGPKRSLIVGLMQRAEGATIQDLIAATGWLPHTTRAALSGLRKLGIAIERSPADRGRGSNYCSATSWMITRDNQDDNFRSLYFDDCRGATTKQVVSRSVCRGATIRRRL